jgi:hypothetical protein
MPLQFVTYKENTMILNKTINKYYLSEAIEEVQELILDGWRVNTKDTYRLGSANQIAMEKEATEEQVEEIEAQKITDWEETTQKLAQTIADSYEEAPTEVAEAIEEEIVVDDPKLEDMSVEDLKEFAKENDIKIHHKASKKEAILAKIKESLDDDSE